MKAFIWAVSLFGFFCVGGYGSAKQKPPAVCLYSLPGENFTMSLVTLLCVSLSTYFIY